MKSYIIPLLSCLPLLLSCGKRESNDNSAVERRLQAFYADSSADIMNEPIPKFSVKTGSRVFPNRFLKLQPSQTPGPTSPLLTSAQVKGTQSYRTSYCKNVLSKQFPELKCDQSELTDWETSERHDKLEDLTQSWVLNPTSNLDEVPSEGQTKLALWSDDYWALRWGATSRRYSSPWSATTYLEAISLYAQPQAWKQLLSIGSPENMETQILRWSPSEKYDLGVGDENFTLTNQQKTEGRSHSVAGDVESWMGICHGWAAAAIAAPPAQRAFTIKGPNGVNISWYPHDVRAITSLAWANGSVANNYVGGRCNTKNTETYPNGRLKDPECFDNNPATFHLVLGNQIGKAGASFVMDTAFDYEVWNQPVYSYSFTYFNPSNPAERSQDWKKVTVPYDDAFKKTDRFQSPLTRGRRVGGKYDDSKVHSIVGVIATVIYVGEVKPSHSPVAEETQLIEVKYHYDLELEEKDQKLVARGGEWHTNYHPDFLWVPEKDAIASTYYDRTPLAFTGTVPPEDQVRTVASAASRGGYPLCQVLSVLLEKSAPTGRGYSCP